MLEGLLRGERELAGESEPQVTDDQGESQEGRGYHTADDFGPVEDQGEGWTTASDFDDPEDEGEDEGIKI